MIKATVFDFGGVLAEEGFREGLKAIGKKNGLDPDEFLKIAERLVYDTGYVIGDADESTYWQALRNKTGIRGSDEEFREELLKMFTLREVMLRYIDILRSSGFATAILSDQTNWLDEIDRRVPLFQYFDVVFNSFHYGKSKKDPSVFRDVCSLLGFQPDEVLFVDDNARNIENARKEGLKVILFTDFEDFKKKMKKFTDQVP
jgi:putative hydrolase of the HAD superfamily